MINSNSYNPGVLPLRIRYDAESIKRGLVLISILLFALPRAYHPALPYAISGFDLCLIPLGLGLLISFAKRGDIALPRDPLFIYILLVPIIFLCSNLVSFLFQNDTEFLLRGILQSVRRVIPAMLLLLLWQTTHRQSDLVRLCKLLVVSTLFGAGLFVLLANDLLHPFSLQSDLAGNPLAILAHAMGLHVLADVLTNYRFAGHTGSPTTYGIICGMQLLMILAMYRREMIRAGFLVITSVLLWLLLLATAAKAVLAITIPIYVVSLCRRNALWAIVVMAVVFMVARQSTILQIASNLTSAGESSFAQRMASHELALDEMDQDLRVLLSGEGWRSREVGWHSEQVELIMGLGLPLGVLSILMTYLYVPWRIRKIKSSEMTPFTPGVMMAMYIIIAFSSLFQDVFHDGNILFVFIALMSVIFKSSAPDGPIPAKHRTQDEQAAE